MKKTVIIACKVIEDELNLIIQKHNLNYTVIWLESKLHNTPEKLKQELNKELENIENVKRVLLALGYCGGACADLKFNNYEVIIPKTDDCLSLLLGSVERRLKISKQNPTYFLSKGWVKDENNVIYGFERDSKKYTLKQVERIYKIMLKNYKIFGIIDTKTYNIDELKVKIQPLQKVLAIKTKVLEADLTWLEKLLTGPWNEKDFFIFKPYSQTNSQMWLNFTTTQ